MTYWTPDAFTRPSFPIDPEPAARAMHARMLAYAAVRRLRAIGQDAAYWKACAPAALARAVALRKGWRCPRLP